MATLVNAIREAAEPRFRQYAITAVATPLSDAAILNDSRAPRKLTVKNANGAANACYLGRQDVAATPANAGVELGAGNTYTFTDQSPAAIYIIGTAAAGNIAFIVAEY